MASTHYSRPHHIVALAYEGVLAFEFSVVQELFGRPREEFEGRYRFSVCAVDPPPVRAEYWMLIDGTHDLQLLESADTIVIPGWCAVEAVVPDELIQALRAAHRRGARLLSICTGAFVLASTGLLDGRRATTHWRWVDLFRARFPEVDLDPDVLYIDEGRLLTSAGSAAGIDLCLHVIRRDLGARVANTVARRMVVPPHRDGGQAQYIAPRISEIGEDGLSRLLDELRDDLASDHAVEDMASSVGMSPRTFARRFRDTVGTTPHRWLIRERVRRSQELLETTSASIDEIAHEAGFSSAQLLRLHFRRQTGTSPMRYRRAFGAS